MVIKRAPRIHVLSIPWEMRSSASSLGATYSKEHKSFVYRGDVIPPALRDFASEPFSYERWVEDDINGWKEPIPTASTYTLRPWQKEGITHITQSIMRGYKGFILADETGLGKTLTSLYGAYAYAANAGFTQENKAKVLIVATKSALPHWINTISNTKISQILDIMVINYDRLKKLLHAPEVEPKKPTRSARGKKTRTPSKKTLDRRHARYGTPTIQWDVVIADESHKLKNDSQRRASFERIARYSDSLKNAPFRIWVSATIGQNPVELAYLAPLAAQLTGMRSLSVKQWAAFLSKHGYTVTQGKVGLSWIVINSKDSPEVQELKRRQMDKEWKKLNELFFSPDAPSIRRSPENIKNYPVMQRVTTENKLTFEGRISYESSWLDFVKENALVAYRRSREPLAAIAVVNRFRQKVSLLKVPTVVELVDDLVDSGNQVLVSVQFMDSIDAIKNALEKRRIRVTEYSGRTNGKEREKNRLAFQKGLYDVILFTVTESVSMQANELLSDGTKATANKRVLVVHDMKRSSIEAIQIEGRAHRDGENAIAYYPYLKDTLDEKILYTMLQRMRGTKIIAGDSAAQIDEINNMIMAIADKEATPEIKEQARIEFERQQAEVKERDDSYLFED